MRKAKLMAAPQAISAMANSNHASALKVLLGKVVDSTNRVREPNSRKPMHRAPATWTMRKFQVSSGKLGRNAISMPVSADSDKPLSAAMWKAA